MGDRANIFFRTGRDGIGVYAHWSGLAMADAAAKVVRSKAYQERLGDATYAIRVGVQIVLETLGASSKDDTGFGLWTPATGPDDNEYRWVVLDVETGDVYVADNWKKPTKADRVLKPTAGEIRRRMQHAPPKAARRSAARKKKR